MTPKVKADVDLHEALGVRRRRPWRLRADMIISVRTEAIAGGAGGTGVDAAAVRSGRIPARSLAVAIAAVMFNRGFRALIPLVLVPITLSYFGVELYGLWMAATALTGMLAFGDLGLGHGLMTRLASCCAKADTDAARRYVSSAYAVLTLLCGLVGALLWTFAGEISWSALLNAESANAGAHARAIAMICLLAYLINAPLSLINSVQFGYRQVISSNVWQAAGAMTALPLGIAAVQTHLPPVTVILAILVGPVLTNLMNNAWTFSRSLREIAPRLGCLDRSSTVNLLRLSGLFAALVAVMAVADNADTFIIAHVAGLDRVAAFVLPARMFTVVGALIVVLNMPFWPANGEALARGDIRWVRGVVRRMTLISFMGGLTLAMFLVLFGEQLLIHWAGSAIGYDPWLFGGLALWWTTLAAMAPAFAAQNGAGIVRPQLLGYALYCAVSVTAKWFVVSRYGIAAIPFVGVLSYAVTVVPLALAGYRRVLTTRPAPDHQFVGGGS
jgi:O-antigen/teichoic acid export membrane protein